MWRWYLLYSVWRIERSGERECGEQRVGGFGVGHATLFLPRSSHASCLPSMSFSGATHGPEQLSRSTRTVSILPIVVLSTLFTLFFWIALYHTRGWLTSPAYPAPRPRHDQVKPPAYQTPQWTNLSFLQLFRLRKLASEKRTPDFLFSSRESGLFLTTTTIRPTRVTPPRFRATKQLRVQRTMLRPRGKSTSSREHGGTAMRPRAIQRQVRQRSGNSVEISTRASSWAVKPKSCSRATRSLWRINSFGISRMPLRKAQRLDR